MTETQLIELQAKNEKGMELINQLYAIEEEIEAAEQQIDKEFLQRRYINVVEELLRETAPEEHKRTRAAWMERIF